jgi:DNA-binding IclR family transcriptional regulator
LKFYKQLDSILRYLYAREDHLQVCYELERELKLGKWTARNLYVRLQRDGYVKMINTDDKGCTMLHLNDEGRGFISTSSYVKEYKSSSGKKLHERWQFWLAVLH